MLTYTPAANANGTATLTLDLMDNGGTANGGQDTSAPQSFVITVTSVNDAPSFTKGADPTVLEDAGPQTVNPWATGISAGPANESGQTLTFNVTGDTNPALFSAAPAISSTGVLTYTPAADANGTATITIDLMDNGGTANGGVDTSAPQSFVITVTSVNDVPSFTKGADQTVLEDAGPQTVTPWATAISPGPANESGQTVHFNVTGNTNSALFSAGPTISPTGVLTYTPAANVSGAATITITLQDDGGTANGGVDTSPAQTFVITVTGVNDAPSSTKGADQSGFDNAGAITVNPWATAISPGPPDESGQTVHFNVTGNTNPGMFAAGPAISPTGVLTYTPAIQGAAGTLTATITITLQDNGGTANGGVDTSAAQTFTIAITHVNIPPQLTTNPITYTTPGNTQLHVKGATLPGVASWSDAQGLKDKAVPTDTDGPGALSVVAASGTTGNGGSYSIATDGAFTYVPAAGFTGTDSFTYQVTDTQDATTGTVNITVGLVVWYIRDVVDANNPAGGDGRSTNAFDSIAAFNAATTNAGDIIYVFEGNTGTTPLSGSITLKDSQKLWGQGIDLDVTGFGTPLVTATNKPRIRSTVASTPAVSIPATAGNRNFVEIKGVDLETTGATSNAIDVTATGANMVSVTISDDNIRGATGKGINFAASTTATYTATVQNDTVTSTRNGVSVTTNAAGTVTLTASTNTISSAANALDARTAAGAAALRLAIDSEAVTAAGSGIVVDGSAAGTTTITSFANNGVSGNTVGSGVLVTSAIFDATPSGTFQTVSGGTTVIGASGNGVGASGMVLTSVAGDLGFTDLDIFADAGAGLSASGTTPYTGSAGFRIGFPGVISPVATVTAVSGPAVSLSTVAMNNFLWQSISSTNSASTGAAFNSVTGTFSDNSGSSVSGTSGTGFQVGSSNATISYAGTLNTTTGKGVDLTTNTGSTISFTGALTLSSGSSTAFNATGGGTVTATNTNSTLTSTTGTALNVASTMIGAAGLQFKSISANGAASGIVLNSTGASGSLSVLGTGSASSGGTIQNTTSHGISLTSTLSPSFNWVNIQNTAGSGVKGTTVTNFTFTNGSINNSGTGGGSDESNIAFNATSAGTENNLAGTVTITGNSLTNALYHGVDIFNFNGTIADAAISNNTITSSNSTATSKGSGIRFVAFGSATTVANVTKATIANNIISNFPSANGILASGGNGNAAGPAGVFGTAGSATNIISITGNRVAGFSSANKIGAFGIGATVNGKGQGNFDISNNGTAANPITNVIGAGITHSVLGNTTSTATINNNFVVANNQAGAQGIGAGTSQTFGATDTPNMTVTITNNNISQTDGNGILVTARDASGTVRAKIQNNTVAAPLAGNRNGIRVDAGNAVSLNDSVCLNIAGNTSAGVGLSPEGIGLRKQGTVAGTNNFALHGFATSPATQAQTAAYATSQNPGSSSGTLIISGDNFNSPTCSFP